jgi:hypothetical protein
VFWAIGSHGLIRRDANCVEGPELPEAIAGLGVEPVCSRDIPTNLKAQGNILGNPVPRSCFIVEPTERMKFPGGQTGCKCLFARTPSGDALL